MYKLLVLAALAACVVSCSSADSASNQKTVDDIFKEGKAAFDDGDWLNAQAQFDIIKLQYPASAYSDDVQYLLAEIFFNRGEYIQAAFNYAMVRRSFPSSEYAKEALYKSAASYYQMSPPPDRDQDYTLKAINAYNEFVSVYATDSLTLKSAERIRELRDKLAEKDILNAKQYTTMQSRKSALVYYDSVIEMYPDSKWVEDALIGKMEIYEAQSKYDDLRAAIGTYRRLVKSPRRQQIVDALERDLR